MATIDPITLATIWHAMQTHCKEMRHVIDRTAQNYLMAQLHDISVGIWDAAGRTLAMPVGLPVQFLGTAFAIRDLLKKFGNDFALQPGLNTVEFKAKRLLGKEVTIIKQIIYQPQ